MTHRKLLDNDFECIHIENQSAMAKVSLQGAHVFQYARHAEEPLLWISPDALYQKGTAIRGGVPVCWPWFGKHPTQSDLPQHGFARTSTWEFITLEEPDENTSIVTFRLHDSEESLSLFPYRFELMLTAVIADTLRITLTTTNMDDKPFTITEALHTYFNLGAIDAMKISGLEEVSYVDFMKERQRLTSNDPIIIDQEVDRVYVDSEQRCIIHDERMNRKITIDKSGSQSTVVWNPWIDKAARMADFANDGYKTMVCIETANALDNAITLQPGQSHMMEAKISAS